MTAGADVCDCLVVGGGPAGLTAALYLARFLRRVTVVDAGEGRARMIPRTHNLGPFPAGIAGRVLLGRMRAHAARYGATILPGTVTAVQRQGHLFGVVTDGQVTSARRVILATGVFNHRPPLSARDHDAGLAQGLIRYCPVCDAHEVRGRRIAVLGQGAHGMQEARFVRHFSPWVTLIAPQGPPGVAQDGIAVPDAPMAGLALDGAEVVVTLQGGGECRFDTLYVALGTTAQTDLAAGLGLRLDSGGHVAVDARQKTSLDGVYAIGDVTPGLDQIAVAMGQGAVAATAIHNDLRP